MLELDEAKRRALSQLYGPTAESQARVLAKLRGTLGGPAGPGGGEGGPPAGGPPAGTEQVVWIAKICAATAGLTGVGLLALKLGATAVSGSDVPEPAAVEAEANEPAPVVLPSSGAPTIELDPTVDSSGAPPSTSPNPPPIQAPSKRRDASSSLAAELALLDAAQRIRTSDPGAALIYLERHKKEFPSGALAPEREKLRIEVSCLVGRMSGAACAGTGSKKSGD